MDVRAAEPRPKVHENLNRAFQWGVGEHEVENQGQRLFPGHFSRQTNAARQVVSRSNTGPTGYCAAMSLCREWMTTTKAVFGARIAQYADPDGLVISVGEEHRGG
jgi:hypothetical protein